MVAIASLSLGLNGLALAWESVAVVVGALVVGLLLGVAVRAWTARSGGGLERERERELQSLRRIADELARASDVDGVVRALLDELGSLFRVEFVALAFVSDDGREAAGFLARSNGRDVDWWRDVRVDLVREPSGIASAVNDATGFAVYDATGSKRISPRLVAETGAKSAAFVPLIGDGKPIAVLSLATTAEHRAFTPDDLAVMQALASEGTIALERTRSALALKEALERERLMADIGRRLRSELDLQSTLRTTVEETGRALGASRCFIRLEDTAGDLPVLAEWTASGAQPIGDDPERLAVSNHAAREQRTVAISDIQESADITEPALGSLDHLRSLGTRAVASTPVVVQARAIGVLSAHRDSVKDWSHGDLALLEAVAAEAGLAIRLGRLLEENRDRIAQQTALLRAAHVLSGELERDTVIQRLTDEVAELLQSDASDCYLYDSERGMLRCAAVHGFDESLVGLELPVGRGLAGLAIREGRPVVVAEPAERDEQLPHEAYHGFSDLMVAPMRWSDDVQGVLGVARTGSRSYSARDADVLEAFAGLASLALRNAETFTFSSRQARVQRGFYRIASVLGQSLSRAATLDAVAQAAAEALGGASSAVLVPQAGGRLALAGSHVLPASFGDLVVRGAADGDNPFRRAAAQSRVIAAPALLADERVPAEWRAAAEEHGYRSLLSIPVETPRHEPGGFVVVFFPEERVFSEDDLELARHLADATRGALERSELFEAERSARALAQQLTRTGRLLTTELDPAAVLDEVVQQAPELVNADACAIRVLEEEQLVVRAAEGLGAEEAVDTRSPADAWLSGDVVQSRAPVALESAGSDARLRQLDPMLAAGNSAYLGVPLAGPEGAPVGVLAVYATEPRPWREEEVQALLALAASTSAALANAELYQRVAEEKERSFAILANIADGIVAVDREGKVVLWNEAAAKISGVPTEHALGRAPSEVLQRTLESDAETPQGDRLVPIMRGREEVWLSVTEAVMRDPGGAVSGRIFAFRDISADRLVEQMKSDFVSTVSHELRTPLTSIYGFAETLLRRDVSFGDEERRTFLGYIASESQRLTVIVDALLNVARLDTGDLQVNLAPTDVRDVVGQVVQSVQETQNGHHFVVELPPEPLAASADPDKLRQVFSILLDNAIKYSPSGGTVTVGAARKRETVEVHVADEGIGIPQADQDQIFRKFYRGADAETRAGAGGTGLGLFIARGLVSAMGGRIWVTSREGEGSTFAFELPLAASSARQTDAETGRV